MRSEIAGRADFSGIRYAQCWEDADILVEALNLRPESVCVSIASAGDNSFALLASRPAKVIALDLSSAQLACVELRKAAYQILMHEEFLELIGSIPSQRTRHLLKRCEPLLPTAVQGFWGNPRISLDSGIGDVGKFEGYFRYFRNFILPFVHSSKRVDQLLEGGSLQARQAFYEEHWNTRRWRMMFRIFFSRFVMGKFGRDPGFFKYVEGPVAERILERTRYALTELDPAQNPYLQWILKGRHLTAYPYALRKEPFSRIRERVNRLEIKCCSVEEFLMEQEDRSIDAYNMSDIFEYMSDENYHRLLQLIVRKGKPGARLVYWNMLAPRSRPECMAERLQPLSDLAEDLFHRDKAFFYSRFVVEEIRA